MLRCAIALHCAVRCVLAVALESHHLDGLWQRRLKCSGPAGQPNANERVTKVSFVLPNLMMTELTHAPLTSSTFGGRWARPEIDDPTTLRHCSLCVPYHCGATEAARPPHTHTHTHTRRLALPFMSCRRHFVGACVCKSQCVYVCARSCASMHDGIQIAPKILACGREVHNIFNEKNQQHQP